MSTNPVTPLSELPQSYIEAYNGTRLVVVGSILLVLAPAFVALRFASRRIKALPFGADDVLILVSLFLNCIWTGLSIGSTSWAGTGRHYSVLAQTDPAKLIGWAKYETPTTVLYVWAATFPKLAVLAFYYRIFELSIYRNSIKVIASVILATWISETIVCFASCQPFAYRWDKTIPSGHCIDKKAFYTWGSLPNVITDIAMLILPLPIVYRLQMPRKAKTGLYVVFTVGLLGLAASAARFALWMSVNITYDFTWKGTNGAIVTMLEMHAYLAVACMLSYRPLVQKLWTSSTMRTLRSGLSEKFKRRSYIASTEKTEHGSQRHHLHGFKTQRGVPFHSHDERLMQANTDQFGNGSSISQPASTYQANTRSCSSMAEDDMHVEKPVSMELSPV